MTARRRNITIEDRLLNSDANPVDVYIGSRLRLRRTVLGISQDELAEEMGVSFQQIQKYEKGANRIAGSRLWELSKLLGIPVTYFYENVDKTLRSLNMAVKEPMNQLLSDSSEEVEREVELLVSYYSQIKDPSVKKSLFRLVRSLAANGDESTL